MKAMVFGLSRGLTLQRTVAAVVVLCVIWPAGACACECEPWRGLSKQKERATIVFAGRVVSVEKPEGRLVTTKTTFAVSAIWKGPRHRKFRVSACSGAMCCLDDFVVGQEYLVYAVGSLRKLGTGFCLPTKKLSEAGKDLEFLGRGNQLAQ